MTDAPLPRIESVKPLPNYRLEVFLMGEGHPFIVSLSDRIARGGVFSSLRDPQTFARVRIGERRRTIYWPKPHDVRGDPVIDIDAESLLAEAERQSALA